MRGLIIDTEIDLTEVLIAFSIIMLMLSVITERAANFLKLYFQNKRIFIFYPRFLSQDFNFWKQESWGLVARLQLLAIKQTSVKREKEREYRVMTINILVGILIAAFANVNFFEILQILSKSPEAADQITKGWNVNNFDVVHGVGLFCFIFFLWSISLLLFNHLFEAQGKRLKPTSYKAPFVVLVTSSFLVLLLPLKWPETFAFLHNVKNIILHIIGYTIVGLFLSLGSKFWHDLLDLLFKFKNAKQRLNEKGTFTDHDSADDILALLETTQYKVTEELYKKYQQEFLNIEGVVSVGLNSALDPNSRLFKRLIEIEYISDQAYEELNTLIKSGSIEIDQLTYYLEDYTTMLATEDLVALMSSYKQSPMCYAYNLKSKNTIGSYGLIEINGKWYAVSNIHVMATPTEMRQFNIYNNPQLKNDKVKLIAGNHSSEATILGYRFGQFKGYGYDYAICEIDDDTFHMHYANFFKDKFNPNIISSNTLKMFGAVSKEVVLEGPMEATYCNVKYQNGFKKELKLNKVRWKHKSVNSGDSGSLIYYEGISGGNKVVKTGMLVAKSDNYAYMFEGTELSYFKI